MAYIELKNSFKRYQTGDTEIIANNDISFEIEKGELVIILGASGAGLQWTLSRSCVKKESVAISPWMLGRMLRFFV